MSQYNTNNDASPAPNVETLTGNSGGAVSPTAGNINTLGTGSITIAGNPGTSTLTTQLTGLTNHSLLVGAGTATITNLGVATNGQLPIGSTGADPVLAGLTAGTNIAITTGAGSISIASSGTPLINTYTSIAFADSPYTVLSTDYYISVNTSGGAITILFPDAPTTNRTFVVKDRTGNSTANNITLTTVGGAVLIDGSATQPINNNYRANSLMFNATSYEIY